MNVICLADERSKRLRARIMAVPLEPLLHGPITNEVADAFEFLTDDELAAFFRARAKAQLDELPRIY